MTFILLYLYDFTQKMGDKTGFCPTGLSEVSNELVCLSWQSGVLAPLHMDFLAPFAAFTHLIGSYPAAFAVRFMVTLVTSGPFAWLSALYRICADGR